MRTETKLGTLIRHPKAKDISFCFFADRQGPSGKLADASIHFDTFPFEGTRLIGFAIWQRRQGDGLNVTFPARSYSVNGERRSFSLFRSVDDTASTNTIRELLLEAYAMFVQSDPIAPADKTATS